MAHYLAMVESRLEKLDEWVIRQVPREKNEKVDALDRITTHGERGCDATLLP